MSFKTVIAALALGLGTVGTAAHSQAQENVMVVFDGSNSMWGQIEGVAKIEIARDTIGDLLGGWTEDRQVGLMAYGHRRRGDCGDIETLVEPQAGTTATIIERVQAISPRGKTPLTDAVEAAATALSYQDSPATVVLISDGLESCDRDPCALAKALEKSGVNFTAHVVGFGLGSDQDVGSLSCVAEETGGVFIEASNATELKTALSNVSQAVAKTPEPKAEPEPKAPEVTLEGPDTAVEGSQISVTWDPTVEASDIISIVPVGTPEGEFGRRISVGGKTNLDMIVPAGPGLYEIRYSASTGQTYGIRNLEVTAAEIDITAANEVQVGSEIGISWTPTIHPQDFLTIVPAEAEAGTIENHIRAGDATNGMITAPGQPGLYELRYVLHIDKKVVGTQTVEVTDAQVEITAPEKATAGTSLGFSWTPTVHPQDFLTIVASDAPEDNVGNHIRARADSEGSVIVPSEPGLYELRYVLHDERRTIGARSVEVTDAKVDVSAPETIAAGSQFNFSWTPTIHPQDFLTIVPVGSPDNAVESHLRARKDGEGVLTAPSEPGLYELRYVLHNDRQPVGSLTIEITKSEVTIAGPDSAVTGSKFDLSWTPTVHPQDFLTIVPVGSPPNTVNTHIRARKNSEGQLTAPAEPGIYELRYVLHGDRTPVASQSIEITEPEVSISAPETAFSGAKIQVSWTGTVNQSDFVTIVPLGTPEGDVETHIRVRGNTVGELQAPGESGLYEVRYVLEEGRKTMASKVIELRLAEVSLSGPAQVRVKSEMTVGWTSTINTADYVALVPMGSPDSDLGQHFTIRDQSERSVKTPDIPGLYELRYVLKADKRVLARLTVDVVAETAALNAGAQIKAPETAAPGSTVAISWIVDEESADQRLTLASPDQAIFTWVTARRMTGLTEAEMTMPEEPGNYELRILDVSAKAVLAQKIITVQ